MRHDATPDTFFMSHSRPRNPRRRYMLPLFLCGAQVVLGCTGLRTKEEAPLRCPSSVQATVSAAKPTVQVSYTEPSMTAEADSLQNLAKTSIYYDLGRGRILAEDVPATSPSGGGTISKTIAIPKTSEDPQSVSICVTATDLHGNESSTTP